LQRLVVCLVALTLLSCSPPAPDGPAKSRVEDNPPLQVVTSVTVLADLIRQVGGERVEVKALVPVGADPYTYQPAPREVMTVARARIVFFNGLGLDRTLRNVQANADHTDLPVVILSDGLPRLESGLSTLERTSLTTTGPSRGNPYLGLDPRLAGAYVERIRDGLSAVDPAGATAYQANANAYLARLGLVDREVEQQLDSIPPERRKLVTLHDAFPYFADRYGLELVAVAITTPGRAPSAQEVADVSRAVQQYAVPTVFTEPQLDARLLKLAARDAGIGIGTLYSDTLDHAVPTYQALLRYNARQLVNGLK
jgi:ABC-type Zn uptake system ZnuABC Zn-binding protein ZnuA